MNKHPNFFELNHPLIKHKLSFIRDIKTSKKEFNELVNEIAMLMTYEITKDLHTENIDIQTPICKTTTERLSGKKICLVPILRAGIGMLEGVLKIIPSARIGHIGLKRNEETHQPESYYENLPKNADSRDFIIIDPMLATGGSAIAAADTLKARGVKKIKFMSLISAPEGVEAFSNAHPDIPVYTACLDSHLNKNAYIVPGLGDAGDRLFGTK